MKKIAILIVLILFGMDAMAGFKQDHDKAVGMYEKQCPKNVKGETVTLHDIKIRKKKGFKIIPTIVSSKAKPHLEVDLNGDKVVDRILFYGGACGNYGDCPYSILVGCGGNVYKMVWKPEYASEFKVLKSKTKDQFGGSWSDIKLIHMGQKNTSQQTLIFKDGQYQIQK